jgi:hypothetical protein
MFIAETTCGHKTVPNFLHLVGLNESCQLASVSLVLKFGAVRLGCLLCPVNCVGTCLMRAGQKDVTLTGRIYGIRGADRRIILTQVFKK